MSDDHREDAGWSGGAEGLRRGALLISFQRFARPAEEPPTAAPPPSLGALPVARSGADFLLPVPDGEAFWIGIMSSVARDLDAVVLEAVGADGRTRLPSERPTPELAVVGGIPLAGGRWAPLDRGSLAALELSVGGQGSAIVRLADPASWAAATGQPPPAPLDPDGGYGGWRLP